MSASTARRGPQGGPPPLAPALAYGALLIAAVAVWIGPPQAGASGFVVPFALLIAGVAVPSLILRLTPRPLAWGGLVVAAVGMVSTLTLLTSALDFTLPIGRFGGLIFIVAASVLLPASRHQLTTATPVAA